MCMPTTPPPPSSNMTDLGSCDYLVVGAGAMSLAFVDTILTEQPHAKIVLVDRHDAPGGHWNDAYDFVHLHQPSLLYGVSSKAMEGSWLRLMLSGTLPWEHRASKAEILQYFDKLVHEWKCQGKVRFYPRSSYDFTKAAAKDGIHYFQHDRSQHVYRVKVQVKMVNGVSFENKVPSKTAPFFPVDAGVKLLTPNQVFEQPKQKKGGWFHSNTVASSKKYVVMGCGKTGMDTIVYLQRHLGVAPSDISWVLSRDVWMFDRDGNITGGSPWSYPEALIQTGGNVQEAAELLYKQGILTCLDYENHKPTRFPYAVIGRDELAYLRKVKNCIRRGRITSLALNDNEKRVVMSFGSDQEPVIFHTEIVFVHCTSPGPFATNVLENLFESDDEFRLYMLYAPPISIGSSCLALLESARRSGTMDIEFGRQLAACLLEDDSSTLSENDILRMLIHGYDPAAKTAKGHIRSIITYAFFLALLNPDPMVGHEWMCQNRLSLFTIPMFRGNVYESMCQLCCNDNKALGFTEQETNMFTLLEERLKPLAGK